MPGAQTSKVCIRCKLNLPLDSFHKNTTKGSLQSLRPDCKRCRIEKGHSRPRNRSSEYYAARYKIRRKARVALQSKGMTYAEAEKIAKSASVKGLTERLLKQGIVASNSIPKPDNGPTAEYMSGLRGRAIDHILKLTGNRIRNGKAVLDSRYRHHLSVDETAINLRISRVDVRNIEGEILLAAKNGEPGLVKTLVALFSSEERANEHWASQGLHGGCRPVRLRGDGVRRG